MAPLLDLFQKSPLGFIIGGFLLLLCSSVAAWVAIYIGMRVLGVPADLARTMLFSIRRAPAEAPVPVAPPSPSEIDPPYVVAESHDQRNVA